jgi:hypothetical protein
LHTGFTRDFHNSDELLPGEIRLKSMRYPLLSSMQYHRGILINRIPVEGIPGALLIAVMMVAILGTPAARQFFLITGAAGVFWAGIIYWWHNQTRW